MGSRDLLRAVELRRLLHMNAELSGRERKTADHVRGFLAGTRPDEVLNDLGGGAGFAVVYRGESPGPVLVLRSDLDALPIRETKGFAHGSKNPEVSHKCGHDGHTAILAGLVLRLASKGIRRGSLVLAFQAAEETGAGALEIVNDRRFQDLCPDYVFALHNLPGYPFGQILIRPGAFTCASRGMIVRLTGASAHAAYPEKALNPTAAFTEILQGFSRLSGSLSGLSLVTVVYARLGEIAFGTTPGNAEIMATLRSEKNEDLNRLAHEAEALARLAVSGPSGAKVPHLSPSPSLPHPGGGGIGGTSGVDRGLGLEISWREAFSATVNHGEAVEMVRRAAEACGLDVVQTGEPFRWSEDFGEFLQRYPGALFCLGAGETHAPLHHPDYDFPDELIGTGICIFEKIVQVILS